MGTINTCHLASLGGRTNPLSSPWILKKKKVKEKKRKKEKKKRRKKRKEEKPQSSSGKTSRNTITSHMNLLLLVLLVQKLNFEGFGELLSQVMGTDSLGRKGCGGEK